MGGLGTSSGPAKVSRATARPIPAFSSVEDWQQSNRLDRATVERLRRDMKKQGVRLHAIEADDEHALVQVWYSHTMGNDVALGAARVARALIRKTGRAYDHYELMEMVAGVESVRLRFAREDFHQLATGNLAEERFGAKVKVLPATSGRVRKAAYRDLLQYPAFSTALNPQVRSNIGGPDAFFVGQLLARLSGTVQITANWSASAALGLNVVDNISDARLRQTFPSGLPRVRSGVGDYLREGRDAYLAQLDTNYVFSLAPDLFGRVSAGIFEEMFGGVASEILYRPSLRSWALGLEVARLRQREFEQRLGFIDYETTTTLASYYQDLPWNGTRLKLTAGRFLAGDNGVQIELSRVFRNGVRFGIFATPTDATTEEFGEGSFDKGFFLSIPIELFSTGHGRGSADFLFRPLSRDGGQRAVTGRRLYPMLEVAKPRALDQHSSSWRH
ncbi:MAG: YjbH domain-containing protein [Algiphilus sp.]